MSKLNELKSRLDRLDSRLEARTNPDRRGNDNTPSRASVLGVPYARKGESALTSRGFQFQRLIGVMGNVIPEEDAKVEMEVYRKMQSAYVRSGLYHMTGGDRFVSPQSKSYLVPFGTDYMVGDTRTSDINDEFRYTMKSMVNAGVENLDPEEMDHIVRKVYKRKSSQSWLDENLGGALVAPPAFGELIQLFRNRDALINAGARVEALPPQGRLKLPRQTTPTTGYFVGENTAITSSTFGTGFLELSARKVAALVSLPNELIRYASPASEAILRADITKTLSLTLDYQLLYGEGSDVYPVGLVNVPNIATVTASDTASGGSANTALAPQDLMSFISVVEANNGEFQGWILRPELFYSFCQARAGVYNGSTIVNQGQFVYDQFRQLGMGFPKSLAGYLAVTTAQVSITRPIAGTTAIGTTVFGGQWDDFIMALFGGVEFAAATQGDTAFAADQTVVRGIISADGAPRHPGVFAVCDGISQSVGV